jgi:hypothetical protein
MIRKTVGYGPGQQRPAKWVWFRGPEEAAMSDRPVVRVQSGVGLVWLMGYLFTIGYTRPDWWHILLGILLWPYQLGMALKH